MHNYKEYWNSNIEKWSDLYLDISHGEEDLKGSRILKQIYNRTVVRYEAYLMKKRFKLTQNFLNQTIHKNMVLNDVGCGTGIFSVQALNLGAKVNAIDISEISLSITKKNVHKNAKKQKLKAKYFLLDAQTDELPYSDITICVGVTPYIIHFEDFLDNILRNTNIVFFQYVDAGSFVNKLRQYFTFLNVRNLIFHDYLSINKICKKHRFIIQNSLRFGTGKILIMSKEK